MSVATDTRINSKRDSGVRVSEPHVGLKLSNRLGEARKRLTSLLEQECPTVTTNPHKALCPTGIELHKEPPKRARTADLHESGSRITLRSVLAYCCKSPGGPGGSLLRRGGAEFTVPVL